MSKPTKATGSIILLAIVAAMTITFSYMRIMSRDTALKSAPVVATVGETEKFGTITGRLVYPSEGIPPSMAAHAINLDTYKVYSTDEHQPTSPIGNFPTYGYELSVPAGSYYVFGTKTKDFNSGRYRGSYAFYDTFMQCYEGNDCDKDRTKVKITVAPGSNTEGITVGDWWNCNGSPANYKATVEWLLEPMCAEHR